MVFGEIIEPTTRAPILDDELEDLPEYKEPTFEWEGNITPPNDIETLVFVETQKVLKVCLSITQEIQPVARLKNDGLSIYKFNNKYLVEFNGKTRNLVIGEIVELMTPWLNKAKSIHGVTSALISTFQPSEILRENSPITFTRCLTNLDNVPYSFCKRLETPNVAKELGASVLTYCIHSNVKCSLWVIFTDNTPIDSINSSEIVKLLKKLGFGVKEPKVSISESNLYM